MSTYLHYIIETRKKNENWKPFFLLANPYKCKEDNENNGEVYHIDNEDFYKKYVFCKANWILRDYIFSSDPLFENSLSNRRLPSDLSEITANLLKERNYAYDFTYFNLDELNQLCNEIENKVTEDLNKETILNFTVEYCQRLGYGDKENGTNECEHSGKINDLNELKIASKHLSNLSNFIDELLDEQFNTYDSYETRIILWLA